MSGIHDMAKDLGRVMGQTEEYQALNRALRAMGDDRELTEIRSRLQELEGQIETELRAGREPAPDVAQDYEKSVGELQANPTYQRVVAAQSNFDKVVTVVNDRIAEGIREGGESRIILAP